MTARSRNCPPESAVELRTRALKLLARREHSRAELARKLAPHAESSETLEAVLALLEQRSQLSDERYAEIRARQLARKYGAARIRHDLKAKGVSADVIARLSGSDDLERARAILARRYRLPAATLEERARRVRFLAARGFAHDVIRQALGKSSED